MTRLLVEKNASLSKKDDWMDIIEAGKWSEIIQKINKKEIDNDSMLEDIQPIIDEYEGLIDRYGADQHIDICLILIGNGNRWSNYSIIFDKENELYQPCDVPYVNRLSESTYFDSDKKIWYCLV